MGFAKALEPLAGVAPLQRLLAVLGQRECVIVTSGAERARCMQAVPGRRVLVNSDPSRGMTSSLQAADGAIDTALALGVLVADKPFIMETTLLACERAARPGADVVYPVSPAGEPGHPVIFSPRARRLLDALPHGDTLRALRDDPSLARVAVPCDDRGAFLDLDTPEEWRKAEDRYGA